MLYDDGGATGSAPQPDLAPPLAVDPLVVDAVDAAIIGDPLADAPEAQPGREIDASDFSSLYVRHRWALECHARRYLSGAHDVDDVVQETFLKLFLAIPEIETELQALAFARRVMTNLCIDRYRAAKRRPSVINLEPAAVDGMFPDEHDIDPVVQAEDAVVVREALALLSPLHRAALVKREIEEKSLPVIAAELGVAEDSVKHLLYRARRALRRLLVGTSVEPGVDLSIQDVARAANRRLARATLSGAHVLVIVVVAALTLVGTWRSHPAAVISEASGSNAGPLAGPVGPGTGVVGATRRHRGAGNQSGSTSHPHHAGTPATPTGGTTVGGGSPHQGPDPSPPTHPTPHPTSTHTPPSKPPATPQPPPAAVDPAFRLNGSLAAAGTPAVSNQVTHAGASTSTALSRFAAPIVGGSFVLDQTLVLSTDGPPALQLQVQVANAAGRELQAASSSTQPAVDSGGGDGQVTVAGQAVADDGSSVNVLMIYNSTITQVLSETVSVAGMTDPTAAGPSTTVSSPQAAGATDASQPATKPTP